MKVLMKPIEVLASFKLDGQSTPLRFKIMEDDIPSTITIEHVSFRSEEKLAGNKMIIFRCQSTLHGQVKVFELKHEPHTGKWFLYKV